MLKYFQRRGNPKRLKFGALKFGMFLNFKHFENPTLSNSGALNFIIFILSALNENPSEKNALNFAFFKSCAL